MCLLIASMMTVSLSCRANDKGNCKRQFPEENVKKESRLFAEKLKLKGDSAEIFQTVFIEYRRQIHEALEANRGVPRWRQKGRRLTEEQVESNIRKRFASARAILDIREKFYPRFREVLSPSQYEKFNFFEQSVGDRMRDEHKRRSNAADKARLTQKEQR